MGELPATICQNIKECHRESKSTKTSLHTNVWEKTRLCPNCWFSCCVSAQFKISSDEGECVYSQILGFGSSYTLLILPNFTFAQNVCHEPTLRHRTGSFSVSECANTPVNLSLSRSVMRASGKCWIWSPTASTWPGRFPSISCWLLGRWSSPWPVWNSPTHRWSLLVPHILQD